jgi:NADPH:quinone reductase-like Zn-dependent oxidoreductase
MNDGIEPDGASRPKAERGRNQDGASRPKAERGRNKEEGPLFADRVRELTGGRGADVCLELVGGAYVPESLAALAERGRLVLVGLMAGTRADVDLALVLRRRLHVIGTVLRARPLEEKILAAKLLARAIVPLVVAKKLEPVIDAVLPLEKAAEAHDRMSSNEGFGKIVLTIE